MRAARSDYQSQESFAVESSRIKAKKDFEGSRKIYYKEKQRTFKTIVFR